MLRSLTISLFVAYLFVIFNLTLGLIPHEPNPKDRMFNPVPFDTIRRDLSGGGQGFVVNFVGNLVAFMPLGVFLHVLRRRMPAVEVAAIAGGISLLIEVLQYRWGKRVGDIDDVLLNTVGALLGFAIFRVLLRLFRPREGETAAKLPVKQ